MRSNCRELMHPQRIAGVLLTLGWHFENRHRKSLDSFIMAVRQGCTKHHNKRGIARLYEWWLIRLSLEATHLYRYRTRDQPP